MKFLIALFVVFAALELARANGTANSMSETFTSNGPDGTVDILFADGNSISTAPNETALANNFQNFVTDLGSANWRMGVVTTDCTANSPFNFCGQLQAMIGGATGQIFISPTTANSSQIFKNTIIRPEASTSCALNNSCASAKEQPLLSAMTAMNLSNTKNNGFFRSDADLALIVMSNKNELSSAPASATTPQQLIKTFLALWPATKKRFVAFGIVVQPGDLSCLNTQRNIGPGSSPFYASYVTQLAQLTFGLTASICADDSKSLASISTSLRQLGNSYDLLHAPQLASITVKITPSFTTTWSVSGSRLTFNPAPPAGSKIEVSYQY